MNLFGTVLTNAAPSANYRGDSAENRNVIQRITIGRFEYAVISPEAIRNALRETLRQLGLDCNRIRLNPITGKGKESDSESEEKQQLAVKFSEYPDPGKYADDFFFGYLMAIKGKELTKLRQAKGNNYPLKRNSVFRMNLAVALEPYRHDSIFTQSPKIKDSPWKPGGGDQDVKSALLHRETVYTAYQYPFALNLKDCESKQDWTQKILSAIGQLNNVAGNHARSYFEFAPASIVLRLTKQLVAGYDTYGFKIENDRHLLPEIIEGILNNDYPGDEFFIGGKIVNDMKDVINKENKDDEDQKTLIENLEEKKVTLERSPQKLLETASGQLFK